MSKIESDYVLSEICEICGETADMHHCFKPFMRPRGCNCHPSIWLNSDIPPVCNNSDLFDFETCEKCQHPADCHICHKTKGS